MNEQRKRPEDTIRWDSHIRNYPQPTVSERRGQVMGRLSKEHLGVIEQDPAVKDVPKLMGHIDALEAENARLRQRVEAADALADEAQRTRAWLMSVHPYNLELLQLAINDYRATATEQEAGE